MAIPEKTTRQEAPRHRAAHRKSRNGCHTCKARRVKCDEAKPICGACASREEHCAYPSTSRSRQRPNSHTSRDRDGTSRDRFAAADERRSIEPPRSEGLGHPSLPSVSPRPLEFLTGPSASTSHGPREDQPLNLVDLRLLSHFLTNTCKKMTLNPKKRQAWETVFPDYANHNEFLMRLSLALAGLDYFYPDTSTSQTSQEQHSIWRTCPGSSVATPHAEHSSSETDPASPSEAGINSAHLEVIIAHHQLGLQGFREALSNLSADNCHEIFVGAMLVVAFAFGSLRVRNVNDLLFASMQSPERTGHVLPRFDWIYLVHGMGSVIQKYWPNLRMGPMKDLLFFVHNTEDYKMYPTEMFTNITVPRTQTWSPRIAHFCAGGYNALQALKRYKMAMDSRLKNHADYLHPTTTSAEQGQLGQALSDQNDTILVLEGTYMRILYVAQMIRRSDASTLDMQADLEDAGVMAWPHSIPAGFLASMEGFGGVSSLSYVIMAYLYLSFTLLEDFWYVKGAFEEDIIKIHRLIDDSGENELKSLMEWPVMVVRS